MNFGPVIAVISCLLSLNACGGAAIQRDGFTLEEEYTKESFSLVRKRASFDLSCPVQNLSYVVLSVYDDAGADAPKQIGVRGCGKQATYTNVNSHNQTWIMDSAAN